ncbi:MAG: WxxxWxxW domain-containing protein, partial [Clostridia bacterium]
FVALCAERSDGMEVIMKNKRLINWIIAIIVAIVYLSVSFIFDIWAYSWLIWVVYAIYRFIVK